MLKELKEKNKKHEECYSHFTSIELLSLAWAISEAPESCFRGDTPGQREDAREIMYAKAWGQWKHTQSE